MFRQFTLRLINTCIALCRVAARPALVASKKKEKEIPHKVAR
jgi:hypothetical protein